MADFETKPTGPGQTVTSIRRIEANRRNARLSTGPQSVEGKQRSRLNALRHGLTAETVIRDLEDAQDYASFELAITADYQAETAVERELVLKLASVLWRLRRVTAIESGLFRSHARQGLQSRTAAGDEADLADQFDQLTRSFVRLSHLRSCPLDRLNRYETSLWRQACQIMITLQYAGPRKRWRRY